METDKLINAKLPKAYQDGIFKYQPGLDNIPDWMTLQKNGWTKEEYSKFQKLIEIEHMKYVLNEAIADNEISKEEMSFAKQSINNAINEYNIM